MDVMALAQAERQDFAALLETLSPEQWESRTLCTDWTVHELVAHVVSYDELDGAGLRRRYVQGRFSPTRVNDLGVREYASRSPGQLVSLLREHAVPTGLTAGFGGRIALVDALIHHQDVRRPLGMPREIPPERLRAALPFARVAPPIRGFWHVRGLRVVATDLDWAAGRGKQVRGPGEALVMAIAGRRGVAQELTGPGRDTLVRRLG